MGTSSVANSALQHLSRFAIASIFVGVGWLALAHPALAQIVYTPTDITIGPNTSYNLDLNNDGVTDFVISTSYACAGGCGSDIKILSESVTETPAPGNSAEAFVAKRPPTCAGDLLAYALKDGDVIGPPTYKGQGTLLYIKEGEGPAIDCGKWGRSKRYLGLAFQVNGETYYGWALLEIDISAGGATLKGYAYETVAGMPIDAGQTE
jgi:hypothetical protein